MKDFNAAKDYYKILGVSSNASIEDLKSAHIKLALKYHPDVQNTGMIGSSSVESNAKRFVEVSEAWQVLSSPELRSKYDNARSPRSVSEYNGSYNSVITTIDSRDITGFQTQRSNYIAVQHAASSNWMDVRDKYKTDKWQQMPLHEKKMSRVRPVLSVGGALGGYIPIIVFGGLAVAYAYITYKKQYSSKA